MTPASTNQACLLIQQFTNSLLRESPEIFTEVSSTFRQSANDREGHKISNVSGNDEKLKVFNCVLHECEIIVLHVQNSK